MLNINESEKHNMLVKKDMKEHILYNFTHIKLNKNKDIIL